MLVCQKIFQKITEIILIQKNSMLKLLIRNYMDLFSMIKIRKEFLRSYPGLK